MITFKEYINERIDASDYTASAEKSKFDNGYRVLVLNKEGKTSYLSQVSYIKEEDAIEAGQVYIDTMAKSKSAKALDDAMYKFRKTHKIVESKDLEVDYNDKEHIMTEKAFKFYDKVGLSKTLPKERGKYFVWDDEGKWAIQDKASTDNSMKVDDILDYYSWDYNLRTSIKVALTDIEKGKYETGEVRKR